MILRKGSQRAPLEVQALYSLGTLARIGNVTKGILRRVLLANGVELVRAGRALFVPLCEVERRIPALWKSLCLAEELRKAALADAVRLRAEGRC